MRNILITGANGQLGKALQKLYPQAQCVDIAELDITDADAVNSFDWSGIDTIINAAAYTNVDGAESLEGRQLSWKVNTHAVQNLARAANSLGATLVHVSTDYVFDGTKALHSEDETFAPLSVYGASKAAGDVAAASADKHYIIRTSWVIGDGKNFVLTMLGLAEKGINPTVVADQIGRLTFTSELVRAIDHQLSTKSTYGVYNCTNSGESVSWADLARKAYEFKDLSTVVTNITTAEYFKGKTGIAPRPLQSTLDLNKIEATGFVSESWTEALKKYLKTL